MTDLWGELNLDRWTWELPRDTPGPYGAKHIPKPLITDWVEKWKPLINDALEKADILDRIEEMGVVTVYDSKHWSTDYNTLKDKLDKVKTHLTKWKSEHSDWQMGRMTLWKEELVQILGESPT